MLTKPERILRNEIEWWEENINIRSTNSYFGLLQTKNSNLCVEYSGKNKLCENCPIKQYTGERYCLNTPYLHISNQYSKLLTVNRKINHGDGEPTKKLLDEATIIEAKLYQMCCKYFEFLKEVQIDMNNGEKNGINKN